jgi:hypothetical protein
MNRVLLDSVASVLPGLSIDRKRRSHDGLPVIGLDQLSGREPEALPFIRLEDLPRGGYDPLEKGDVVLPLIGRLDRVLQVTGGQAGAILDRECAAVRLREDVPVTSDWLYLWARSSDCRLQMEWRLSGVIPRVRARDIRLLQVPIVGVHEQEAAVARVARLDAAVESAHRASAVLTRLRDIEVDLRVFEGAA